MKQFAFAVVVAVFASSALAEPAASWKLLQLEPSQPGAVFQDGEEVKLVLTFDKPLSGSYRVVRIRNAGALGNLSNWVTSFTELRQIEAGPLPELAGEGGRFKWSLSPRPKERGVYVIYVKAEGEQEALAATFALVPRHIPGWRYDHFQMTNWNGTPWNVYDEMAAVTQRLGFKWTREETGWQQKRNPDGTLGEFIWDKDDRYAATMRKYQIYGIIGGGHAPIWAWPKNEEGKPIYYAPGKPSTVPAKQYLDGFEQWHEEYVRRYGDVVRILDLFNEPWEGSGISGFGSTGAHLREMMRRASAGAHRADPTFLVGGCDSHSENEDHLLCDPGATAYIDYLAYHTFMRHVTFGPYQARRYGKEAYDTESWVGPGVSTPFGIVNALAMGFKMCHPYWQDALVLSRKKGTVMPAGAASQAAAVNYFLTDMDYVGQPNPRCLPYLFVFQHRAGSPTKRNYASLVYLAPRTWPWVGNNHFVPEAATMDDLYRDIRLRGETWDQVLPSGTFTIPDPRRELTVYDFDANPLPDLRRGDAWRVPLAMHQHFYITCTAGADRLMELLRAGKLEGLRPVQITLHDFTARVQTRPPVRVSIQNVYNEPISGSVSLTAPDGWRVGGAKEFANLPAGAKLDLEFPVLAAAASPQNLYPFAVRVTTTRGDAEWREELRANVVARGTITPDGIADDWQAIGFVPQTFFGTDIETDPAVRYMKPYEELRRVSGEGFYGSFAAAWDDNYFYCLLRLNDPQPDYAVSMAKGEWYKMYPGTDNVVYAKAPAAPMMNARDMLQLAFDFERNLDDFNRPDDPMYRAFPFRETDYEYSLYPTREAGPEVWRLYLPGTYWQCHYAPFSPNPYSAQGIAADCKAAARHDGTGWTFELAIPWSEMPRLARHLKSSRTIEFAYRVRRNGGSYWSTQMRSVAKRNGPSWHPDYMCDNWSVDTEWGFEQK